MTAEKVVPLRAHPAPKHLSLEAVRVWHSIAAEYSIVDPAGLLLLTSACEAYDRVREAQKAIREDGMISKGSKRQARAHPLLAALKALNLDLEPLRDRPGRPPGTFNRGELADAD